MGNWISMKPSLDLDEIINASVDPYRLYYYPDNNIIVDECGFTIYNIFGIIDPNTLYLFKKNKESVVVRSISGGEIELHYCIDEEE
jgi:hypothetical protein